ncbi:HTH-type transcriptional regulatory protein GabR [Streptomyces sp. RB5]|uniref:HTH-type transcriptional regulatory protein GabR n=1 Tax=Streptomyces smaragdinus TaxID=2585196 RepID=A0A7K0CB49_9ACTN|nr:PLP-dependent aminotransferase family protein [Streptomyces smaragdinus]MQY10648.1 HTH-type transcriptional regulatory protein GabR [Streptomyces smaragdinus]
MGLSGTNEWAAAWELLLPAVAAPPRRRGRTLQAALRDAVRSGRLAAGTRLPASRELAADLGVSRGLVTDAYEQLTAEGYLRAGRGAGTWVASVGGALPAAGIPDGERELPDVDFKPGTPDLSLFPRAAWTAAQRRALAGMAHRELGYPDPRGLPALRRVVAGLLLRRRGVVADAGRVIVCSGVAQAMTLLGLALHGDGHRLAAVEDPGSPPHAAQFEAVGIRAVGVPLDGEGIRVDALEASGAGSVVVTPAHQFPSGIAYSAARRGELLAWARGGERLIVEDDYDGEFRYDRAPVGALQGLDPERVAYSGSVSKSLAPGLRLGWLVVPDRLVAEVTRRKLHLDLGNSVLDQAAFADLVERGDYDRHLRRCQRAYRDRRDALVAALAESLPGAAVTGIAAGLHVIVALPAGYGPRAEPLVAAAAEAGVRVMPLSAYGRDGAADGRVRLVLGYAHLAPGEIARGVRLLRGAWEASATSG